MKNKLCCIVKTYLQCGECDEKWCPECWKSGYYTRDHGFDDVEINEGWYRIFFCPTTKRRIMREGWGDIFTHAAYKTIMTKITSKEVENAK